MKEAMEPKDDKYGKWEIDAACDTLLKAEELKKDPKMMKLVTDKLNKKKAAITSIQQLKAAAKDKIEEGMDY